MTSQQGEFFNMLDARQRARATDPATSKAAAAQLNPAWTRGLYQRILRAFKILGDMDDKALIEAVRDMEKALGIRQSSESGIRSRRAELSKPNMDRLEELRAQRRASFPTASEPVIDGACRAALRIEGFRSPVWDTGKREKIDGRDVIVWGLAQ